MFVLLKQCYYGYLCKSVYLFEAFSFFAIYYRTSAVLSELFTRAVPLPQTEKWAVPGAKEAWQPDDMEVCHRQREISKYRLVLYHSSTSMAQAISYRTRRSGRDQVRGRGLQTMEVCHRQSENGE